MANFMERVRNLFTHPARIGPVDLLERHAEGGHVRPEDVHLARKLRDLNLLSLERHGDKLFAKTTKAGQVLSLPGVFRILEEYREKRPVEGPDKETIRKLAEHGFIQKSLHAEFDQLTGSTRKVTHVRTTGSGREFLRSFPGMHEVPPNWES